MKQRLTILGEPKAQKRHRHFKRGEFVGVYDPSKKAKEDLLSVIQDQAPDKPYDEPLRVDTYLYFQRPKAHYGTGRNAGKLKPSAPRWHTKKPDKDNVEKKIFDSMSKVFWRDDSIICHGRAIKQYSAKPRIEIVICSIDEPTPDVYLKYFGFLAMQHIKTLEGFNKRPDAIDSHTLKLLKGLVGVAVSGSDKFTKEGLIRAVAWLNKNYKLEGIMK